MAATGLVMRPRPRRRRRSTARPRVPEGSNGLLDRPVAGLNFVVFRRTAGHPRRRPAQGGPGDRAGHPSAAARQDRPTSAGAAGSSRCSAPRAAARRRCGAIAAAPRDRTPAARRRSTPGRRRWPAYLRVQRRWSRSVVRDDLPPPIATAGPADAVLLRRAAPRDRRRVRRRRTGRREARRKSLDVVAHKPRLIGALQGMRFWLERGRDALQFARQLPGYDPTRTRTATSGSSRSAWHLRSSRACSDSAASTGPTVHGALGRAPVAGRQRPGFGSQAPRRLALNSLADLRGVLSGALSDADLGLYNLDAVHRDRAARRPDFWALAARSGTR